MTDSLPWRARNLERIAEARRILATARTKEKPVTVNPDLDPEIVEEPGVYDPPDVDPEVPPELDPDET